MNSRVLLGLALLLIGAALLAFWAALPANDPPQPPAQTEAAGNEAPALDASAALVGTPVVYVVRDLAPGTPVQQADVAIQEMVHPPPDTYTYLGDVIGRTVSSPVASGSLLYETAFAESTSPIVDRLREDE